MTVTLRSVLDHIDVSSFVPVRVGFYDFTWLSSTLLASMEESQVDGLIEEIRLLHLSATDDFEWSLSPAATEQWEAICQDSTAAVASPDDQQRLVNPSLRLRLSDLPNEIFLSVQYRRHAKDAFDVNLHCPSAQLPVDLQRLISDKLVALQAELRQDAFPVFSLYTALREYVQQTLQDVGTGSAASFSAKADEPNTIRIKRVLIWSHHLLATGKRKLIVQVCLIELPFATLRSSARLTVRHPNTGLDGARHIWTLETRIPWCSLFGGP